MVGGGDGNAAVAGSKTRLRTLIEDAQSEGPQIVTRLGRECAVVLSIRGGARSLALNAERNDVASSCGYPGNWAILT